MWMTGLAGRATLPFEDEAVYGLVILREKHVAFFIEKKEKIIS